MKKIYPNFDFKQIYSSDFKEDSVREVLILPMLQALGYDNSQIVRSKALAHPFLKIGSQKRPVNLVPDYLLKIEENYAWVLDAKAPNEEIKVGDNVAQVYSYAIHPEIRTKFFALCNGKEFILFRQDEKIPLLHFDLQEIENHWDRLSALLAPTSFQIGAKVTYENLQLSKSKENFDYLKRPIVEEEIAVRKQAAKRHFGVHGYFTKQAWNVVHEYILNFTQPNDLVLDPFGGSGVTAIEAMMTGRKAIHIDLNPMSVFIVECLIAPVSLVKLQEAFEKIKTEFLKNAPQNEEEIQQALIQYPHPQGIRLPKGSDVSTVEQLFSDKQLAQLGFLKHLILKEKDKNSRKSLLLAFSSTLTVSNLTTHAGESGGPNSGAFAYYRYRMANTPAQLTIIDSFETKLDKVINAKKEIISKINENTISGLQVRKGTATNLDFLKKESVDYIYTDPPYGKKIPYLDLSVMWNAWLDLSVSEQDYEQEAIEGGEHNKSKDEYNELMAKSIQEMYRVLKFDRWLSFVFAHKDPEFWHLIIETAEKAGFEYAGAVRQANGQTSFKKRQNPFTVLAGQLIINFKKVKNPKTLLKASIGADFSEVILDTIESVIYKYNGATLEQINNDLIIKGLELGFFDLLRKEYYDLTPLLMDTFDYDEKTEKFNIKKKRHFKMKIDEKLRIRYFITSYLNRVGQADFDDIVLDIMPLLKNGTTPENQTILKVLTDIAERTRGNQWRLKTQKTLF